MSVDRFLAKFKDGCRLMWCFSNHYWPVRGYSCLHTLNLSSIIKTGLIFTSFPDVMCVRCTSACVPISYLDDCQSHSWHQSLVQRNWWLMCGALAVTRAKSTSALMVGWSHKPCFVDFSRLNSFIVFFSFVWIKEQLKWHSVDCITPPRPSSPLLYPLIDTSHLNIQKTLIKSWKIKETLSCWWCSVL